MGEKFMVIFWIIVLVAAVLVEAATAALISIWFAAGALAAVIAAALDVSLTLQLILFVAFTGITLMFTRPFVKKLFPKKFVPTNSDSFVGKTAVVIEEVDSARGLGRVKLNGVDWIAVTENNDIIEKDSIVRIKKVRGAKLLVEKL